MSPEQADQAGQWTSVRAKAEALIASVKAMSPEQRTVAPPKGLTALETILHLSLTDKYEIELINKNHKHRNKAPRMNFIGSWAIRGMKAAKPVPTIKSLLPQASSSASDADVDAAASQWQETLTMIGEAIATASPNKTLFKHPAFGLMGPLDLIALMDSHLDYHIVWLRQAGVPV